MDTNITGLPGNPVTNASGDYNASVEAGWSGTAVPVKTGYGFSPSSYNYSNVTSDQLNQDYLAAVLTYTISGRVTEADSGLEGTVITGLPGSGKSAVARAFAALGAASISLDVIGHTLLHHEETKARLKEQYGAEIFDADGKVLRPKLGAIVFNDAEALQALNSIMHPRMADETRARIAEWRKTATGSNDVAVLEGALIFEMKLDGECDHMVWVESPAKVMRSPLSKVPVRAPAALSSRVMAVVPTA